MDKAGGAVAPRPLASRTASTEPGKRAISLRDRSPRSQTHSARYTFSIIGGCHVPSVICRPHTFAIGTKSTADKQNWLKTVPGRGWFSLIRWYGPTQEFFDHKYKPGDFVKV